MISVTRSRQRAERFADLVDAHPAVGSAGRSTGTSHDGAAEPLAPLVALAGALRAHAASDPAAVPRESFAVDLRERLLAEAATVLSPDASGLALRPQRPVRARSGHRRAVAVATAAVLLGGSAGMAAAAEDALPGEVLYPVKRGIERAEATLSLGRDARGRDLLHQADDRLAEVSRLLDDAGPTALPQVTPTLHAFDAQAAQGAGLLTSAYQDSRDPRAVADLRSFTARSLRTLEGLSATAPADARPALQEAADALVGLDAEARRLCATCSDLPSITLPATFRVASDAGRALSEATREAAAAPLDNSHPPATGPRAPGRSRHGAQHDAATGPAPSSGSASGSAGATDGQDGQGGSGSTGGGSPAGPLVHVGVGGAEVEVGRPSGGASGSGATGEGLDGTVRDTVDGTLDGVDDTVDGLVGTLLPGPQDSPLP